MNCEAKELGQKSFCNFVSCASEVFGFELVIIKLAVLVSYPLDHEACSFK